MPIVDTTGYIFTISLSFSPSLFATDHSCPFHVRHRLSPIHTIIFIVKQKALWHLCSVHLGARRMHQSRKKKKKKECIKECLTNHQQPLFTFDTQVTLVFLPFAISTRLQLINNWLLSLLSHSLFLSVSFSLSHRAARYPFIWLIHQCDARVAQICSLYTPRDSWRKTFFLVEETFRFIKRSLIYISCDLTC